MAEDLVGKYVDGKWRYDFNGQDLEPGVYFVRVRSDTGLKVLKVIKIKRPGNLSIARPST